MNKFTWFWHVHAERQACFQYLKAYAPAASPQDSVWDVELAGLPQQLAGLAGLAGRAAGLAGLGLSG